MLSLFYWLWAFLCIQTIIAYRRQVVDVNTPPIALASSDHCIVVVNHNITTVRFFHKEHQNVNITSSIVSVNNDCSMILFGYPEENKVVIWNTHKHTHTNIMPSVNVPVARFGFSLDIQNQTWIVGAPGQPTDNTGQGATMGYAFLFEGEHMHSCLSMIGSGNTSSHCKMITHDVTAHHQFGYAVALTGPMHETHARIVVSAPGDTNRFMEDNNGQNFGRVYTNTFGRPLQTLEPPTLAGVTYRAFGRALAVSKHVVAVSTYPLYDEPDKPFILLYDCDIECALVQVEGFAINDLPGNVLGYLSAAELSYTDGKTGAYIPVDVEGDLLDDFQNAFIGRDIGIIGSNVLIADENNQKVYRIGTDGSFRESHTLVGTVGFGTNTQHWAHGQANLQWVHLWGCPPGQVGLVDMCAPCPTSYFSADGWLDSCDICPVNYTTNQTGQSKCSRWFPPVPTGLKWSDAMYTIVVIAVSTIICLGLFVICECCSSTARRKRQFVDTGK